MYEIIYDYTDDCGNENRNLTETFTGSWTELQDHIKLMRKNDCYNITVSSVRD